MIHTICREKLLRSLSCTDPNYMNELKKCFNKDIITPKYSVEEIIKLIQMRFSLYREEFSRLNAVTYESLKSSVFSEEQAELWVLPESTQSQIYYKDFERRFYSSAVICLLYLKNKDRFYSNSAMFGVYVSIQRGIDEQDITNNTPLYKKYLNDLFIYNRWLMEAERKI